MPLPSLVAVRCGRTAWRIIPGRHLAGASRESEANVKLANVERSRRATSGEMPLRSQRRKERKCMGIEPTSRTFNMRLNDFEDRGRHQPCRHFRSILLSASPPITLRYSVAMRKRRTDEIDTELPWPQAPHGPLRGG